MDTGGGASFRNIRRSGKRVINRLLGRGTAPPPVKTQIWSIGIYTGESPFVLGAAADVANPVLTHESVSDVPARFVADPFMIKALGTWQMFFEVLNSASGRGEIGLATSDDALHWKYRQIVLKEPFHLSYPYVFECDHEYYLVPESYQANSVRLYRAVDFPVSWAFAGNLLAGSDFQDSSPFRFENRWWLLTDHAQPPYYAGKLRLFYADRLMGPWTEHPKSPVVDGNPHIARPAGRVLVHNDRVFRFTQDCCPVYGAQVRAFELTQLTTRDFQEEPLGVSPVLQAGRGWNAGGMHHIDPHLIEDRQWIACVDGWYWTS